MHPHGFASWDSGQAKHAPASGLSSRSRGEGSSWDDADLDALDVFAGLGVSEVRPPASRLALSREVQGFGQSFEIQLSVQVTTELVLAPTRSGLRAGITTGIVGCVSRWYQGVFGSWWRVRCGSAVARVFRGFLVYEPEMVSQLVRRWFRKRFS